MSGTARRTACKTGSLEPCWLTSVHITTKGPRKSIWPSPTTWDMTGLQYSVRCCFLKFQLVHLLGESRAFAFVQLHREHALDPGPVSPSPMAMLLGHGWPQPTKVLT